MENNMNEKIYIKITNAGVCRTLGYMVTPGPVVRCTLSEVYDILNEGFTVTQVDENDKFIDDITLQMFVKSEKDEDMIEESTIVEFEIKKEDDAVTETIGDTPIVETNKRLNNKWKNR